MFPRFSLQSVLDYRSSLVEALEIELGVLTAALLRARSILEAMREKRTNLIGELRSAMLGELNLIKISQLRTNIELLDVRIARQEEEVEKISQEVEAKRQELVKARQDEEVLVILKEKAITAFQNEMKLRENRTQDDVYIASHYQKQLREAEQKNG
jgi:flagellar export protein FliJ